MKMSSLSFTLGFTLAFGGDIKASLASHGAWDLALGGVVQPMTLARH